jgi:hypothetical protein
MRSAGPEMIPGNLIEFFLAVFIFYPPDVGVLVSLRKKREGRAFLKRRRN